MTRTGLDHLEHELRTGVRRHHRPARRPWRHPLALSFAATLVTAGGALAATGVIPIGRAVPAEHEQGNARRDTGPLTPGTAKVLALRAPDPAGGPPWAVRVQATTRHTVCMQAARVVDDQLGVLGRDGAFDNDGQFHALPDQSLGLNCGALDANGNTSLNVAVTDVPASGASHDSAGTQINGCGPPTGRACPRADLRYVSYGLLGRNVASIAYTDDNGKVRSMRVEPPYGAYLIVQSSADTTRGVGTGPNPFGGPIRSITFRDGRRCTSPTPNKPTARCPLPGLADIHNQYLSPSQVTSRVSANTYLRHGSYRSASVSFRARVGIATAGQAYVVLLRHPRARHGFSVIAMTRSNVAVGSVVTERATYPLHSGTYRGEVRLVSVVTPGHFTYRPGAGALVGSFEVRVPG
jgi:hypothetical protein